MAKQEKRWGNSIEREAKRISSNEGSSGLQWKALDLRLPGRPLEGPGGARVLAAERGGVDPEQRKEIAAKAKKDILSKATNRSGSKSRVINFNGATPYKQIKGRRRQTNGAQRARNAMCPVWPHVCRQVRRGYLSRLRLDLVEVPQMWIHHHSARSP